MEIIEQIGSYAGLAAIVGLAVMSALYFSQARDVKRLREWAGRAPERTTQPSPQRVVAQPQPKPTPAQPVAQPGTPGTPGQPPAVPTPPQGPPQVPGAPAPAIAASAGASPATATAATAGTAAAAATADRPSGPGAATPAGQGKQGPADAPPAGSGDNGEKPDEDASEAAAAATAPDTAAPPEKKDGEQDGVKPPPPAVSPAGTDPPTQAGPPTIPPPPTRAATPAGQARPVPPSPPRFTRSTPPTRLAPQPTAIIPPGSSATAAGSRTAGLGRGRIAALAVAGVLVIGGGAAFAVSQLTGDDESPTNQTPGSASNDADGEGDGGNAGQGVAAVDPADVTVAILNGTLVPGLAANVGDEAERLGFDVGTIGDASDQEQQRAESVVLYASGHRRDAVVVSRRLKIGQREQIDPDTQALAGDAGVVVIAGADKTP